MNPVIVVLEDTDSRVAWLRRQVEPFGVKVIHHALVRTFLDAIIQFDERIVGIVLDHDLGGFSMQLSLQDVEGLDGMDAVEKITKLDTRFLIWSSNRDEAPRMEAMLRSRGAATVERLSWGASGGIEAMGNLMRKWVQATRE